MENEKYYKITCLDYTVFYTTKEAITVEYFDEETFEIKRTIKPTLYRKIEEISKEEYDIGLKECKESWDKYEESKRTDSVYGCYGWLIAIIMLLLLLGVIFGVIFGITLG